MKISIFLSVPKPHLQVQQDFLDQITRFLDGRGFSPRTLGITDYDMDAPLKAIRRLLLESNGLITLAFRRTRIDSAVTRPDADLPDCEEKQLSDTWLTSPYCHIEPAMAYQLGLPVLIFRENGVAPDGLLDRGVIGTFMPVFDTSTPADEYLNSTEFNDILGKWEGLVRRVVETKGSPPALF